MRIFWLCQLQQYPRPNYWQPYILSFRDSHTYFPCYWSTTDLDRAFKYAVGVAEVTADQLVAIEADSAITLFDQSLLFTTFGSLNGAVRNKINSFLDSAGIARPTNSEVLHDVWTRVSQVIDFKSVDDLIAMLDAEVNQ